MTFGSGILDPSSVLHHMYNLGLVSLAASVSSLFSLLVVIIFLVIVLWCGTFKVDYNGRLPGTRQ